MTSRRGASTFALLVVAVGINLRTPITSVSASLTDIDRYYGLGPTFSAVLVSLPVIMFSLAAPIGPWLRRRVGVDYAIVLLQGALAAALALRVLSPAFLLIGTAVAGAAITGSSVLATAVFRRSSDPVATRLTSAFTLTFGVGAALGAWVTSALGHADEFSPRSLAVWSIPAAVAAIALAVTHRRQSDTTGAKPVGRDVSSRRLLRRSGPWWLAGYFGLQATLFFTTTAWLTSLLRDRGLDPSSAALALTVMSLAGLPATLLVPRVAERAGRRRPTILAIALLCAVGVSGLAWSPLSLTTTWALLLGFAQGGAFALSLTLVVWRSSDSGVAAALSASTQGIGYAVAAIGPFAAGILHTLTSSWDLTVALLLAVVVAEGVVGWMAARTEVVTDRGSSAHGAA